MEIEALEQVEKLAMKKSGVYRQSRVRYAARSALAGMFVGIGVIAAFKTGNYFNEAGSPLAYPAAALTFGAAIVLISYGGADLFTGNTFYLAFAALRKKLGWGEVGKLWAATYAGNALGACALASLVALAGLFADRSASGFLLEVAEHKAAAPVAELFFRGILCNWLVCLAFFLPMRMRGEGAKMFAMMLCVFCFFVSGYEHSVANMAIFAVSLTLDRPETVTAAGALRNLIPVTLGNVVGGSVFMGVMYYYANKPFLRGEERPKR
ncbi:formate/nitrite transporter family protein [Cohnella massiliensis]|uniref:formate/nitrite transporter family protein n=1 Tax=Cohnella massiliensis TaxID=1816691 RepID=UPI0009BA926D|nr:formate/nitrite transporter family protein [Cohnella massiliensis]